jgi:SAM-dependent methyltransferase
MPGTFMPPNLADKLCDLNALALAGGVNGRDVLNQGPSYPIDEILLGPYSRTWMAIDADASCIDRSRLLGLDPRIGLYHGSIAQMPSAWTERFDLILNFSTLDNIEPGLHAACLRETARVLRHGGQFLMTYANHQAISGKLVRSGDWVEYRFDPAEVAAALVANGLHVSWHDHAAARAAVCAVRR